MTEPSDTVGRLRKYRWPIIILAILSSSTVAFTAGCALTRYLTDSVKVQLVAGLIVAVLLSAVMLFLAFIRKDKSAARQATWSDGAMATLMPFGMTTLFFPLVCPEAFELLKQHIPLVVIDAIVVCGGIALLVYCFLFMAKLVRQLEEADS